MSALKAEVSIDHTDRSSHKSAARPPLPMARRYMFSPSPPPLRAYPIPPVPPLPNTPDRQRRPRAATDFAGVFLPMNGPHPLEGVLELDPARVQAVNLQQNVEPPPPREQQRRPNNMGLGGALLALNRRNEWENPYPRTGDPPQEGLDFLGLAAGLNHGLNAIRRFFNVRPDANREELEPGMREALELLGEEERNRNIQQHRPNGQQPDRLIPYTQRQVPEKELTDYKPYFTHPDKVESGFSNDFALQESNAIYSDGGSSSSTNEGSLTELACAGCSDALVMNVTGPEDIVRKTKLWALRCGHILDGKCIEQIMKPPPPAPPPVEENGAAPSLILQKLNETNANALADFASSTDKGKRKADALDGAEQFPVTTDRKGKGRAYPVIPLTSTAPVWATMGGTPSAWTPAPDPSSDSIRSRLRPRNASVGYADNDATDVPRFNEGQPQQEITLPPPPPGDEGPVTRSRRGRGRNPRGRAPAKSRRPKKGKAKPKAPVIEAEHVWHCPVASCQREHKSHLIEGQWKMAENEGAIPMYC